MRYLLPLFFAPSVVFASCAPGVNYGSAHIVSPNPICYLYSGSTQGGCYAYCGGGSDGSVCVELPNAVPPSRGPYFSSGQECTPTDSNGPGKDPNPPVGEDGTAIGGNGVVNMGELWVGQNSHADLGKGFNVVSNNVKVSSEKVAGAIEKQTDNISKSLQDLGNRYLDSLKVDLPAISRNTGAISNSISSMPFDLRVSKEHLSNIDANISKLGGSSFGPNQAHQLEGITVMMGQSVGFLSGLYSINGEMNQAMGRTSSFTEQILDNTSKMASSLSSIEKSVSGGGGGGDKPCTGPLCSFNKPSGSSGSALSSVFGPESIEDVKAQVETKNGEIMKKMDEIKKVFVSEQISISGTYNNDYQDVHGVKVDLSGKSNMELFFNSGPKTAIWFIAVLIAFTILMGGRKNA